MKKIIIAMFALCCFAVLPATAHQVKIIELDLDKDFVNSIKGICSTGVNQQISEDEKANLINKLAEEQTAILQDLQLKYAATKNEYYLGAKVALSKLIEIMNKPTINRQFINQELFMAIDDLAYALNHMSTTEKTYYENILSKQLFYFTAKNKIVNISELYQGYASQYHSSDNSYPIENSRLTEPKEISLTIEEYLAQINKTAEKAQVLQAIKAQNSAIKQSILNKVETAEKHDATKYSQVYNLFVRLENIANQGYDENMPQEDIGQAIFTVLDDLAKAIANLPSAEDRQIFTDKIANTVFYFQYRDKVVNTSKLFDIATSYKDLPLFGTTAIEKSKLSNMNLIEYSIEEYAGKMNK